MASAAEHVGFHSSVAETLTPTPVLRLYTEKAWITDKRGKSRSVEVPVLALRFDYEGRLVRPQAADPWLRSFQLTENMDEDEVDLEVLRDEGFERAALCRLEQYGVLDVECLDDCYLAMDSEADYLVRADDNVHGLCSFTAVALGELRAAGWRVEIATDYPYQVVDPDAQWYAEVSDEKDADWFSLELGVMSGEARINLLPALLELLEAHSQGTPLEQVVQVPARFRALRVDDNRYVVVPPKRLAIILGVLQELYDGETCLPATLAFPGVGATPLSRLDEAFGDEPGQLDWQGNVGIRDRGKQLGLPGEARRVPTAPELNATLRPYQQDGLDWLQHLVQHDAGGVLADDMGLGKTLQCIAHIASLKQDGKLTEPALIVMPTSLVGNWRRELLKFAPHLRVAVLHGPRRRESFHRIPSSDVVLTTYPVLVRDVSRFEDFQFSLLILDEAQAVKNARSLATGAVRAIHAQHRLCLSGTPVENNLDELWSLFDFLMPGLLGSAQTFKRRFRYPIEKEDNELQLEVLRRRVSPYILRRTKASVLRELPPKTELTVPVYLSGSQRDLYEGIRVAAHSQVRRVIRKQGFSASTIAILDALMKLRQVCCDPRLVGVPSARRVKESAKYQQLMDLVRTLLGQEHRILIFSQFTQMLSLIARGLEKADVPFAELNGSTQDRQTVVDRFERGKADVFLISLKAGGTGLNLTSADTVIHYDPWWNPAAQAQATDRAYRMGQKRPVFVHNLVVVGSVEERMLKLQERKRALAAAILSGEPQADLGLSEEEVENLFAPLDEDFE